MGDCCCNPNVQGGACCYKMVTVGTSVSLLVSDANSCAGKMAAPETTSVAMWIDGRIVWSNGSSITPICLGLQEAAEIDVVVGQTADGCLTELQAPSTNSVLFYSTSGAWADGSVANPICLDQIQENATVNSILGQTTEGCLSHLISPATPSVLFYDGSSWSWADGSVEAPICLTQIQTITDLTDMAYMLGVNDSGCLVKIAITADQVTTCEGPVLTVPVTAVS